MSDTSYKITSGRLIDIVLLPVDTKIQTHPFRFKFEKTLSWNVGGELMEFYSLDSFYARTTDLGRMSWTISCSNYVEEGGLIDTAIKTAVLNNYEFYVLIKYNFMKKVTYATKAEPIGLSGHCFISDISLNCSNGDYVEMNLTLTGKGPLKQIYTSDIDSIRYGLDVYFDTSSFNYPFVHSKMVQATIVGNSSRIGFQNSQNNPTWSIYDKLTNNYHITDTELNRGVNGGQREKIHYYGDLHDRTDWYYNMHSKLLGFGLANSSAECAIYKRKDWINWTSASKTPTFLVTYPVKWCVSSDPNVSPTMLRRNYTIYSDGSIIEEWLITLDYVGTKTATSRELFLFDY